MFLLLDSLHLELLTAMRDDAVGAYFSDSENEDEEDLSCAGYDYFELLCQFVLKICHKNFSVCKIRVQPSVVLEQMVKLLRRAPPLTPTNGRKSDRRRKKVWSSPKISRFRTRRSDVCDRLDIVLHRSGGSEAF